MDYYENGTPYSISFQNRWENGNKLDETVGSGTIITYKFQLEPGEYSFTNNVLQDGGFNVLTPDLELPDFDGYDYQAHNLEKYVTQVNGPVELFAIYGRKDFLEENADAFVEYAKSVANSDSTASEDILKNIDTSDYGSLEELLNALRDAGLSDEQIEMAKTTYAEAFETADTEMEGSEVTAPVVEEPQEEAKDEQVLSPVVYIIVIIFVLVIVCCVFVFIKRNKVNE
jgi:hypothetical protein